MYDFNKYDDVTEFHRYEGFIDRNGYFYKVSKREYTIRKKDGSIRDSHNEWAETFLKEKMNINKFKFNPTTSALLTLTKLNGPAEFLIQCFGFVYYSHDPIYFKPIIKIPNPKIGNYKITDEQLDTLFSVMLINKEDTNIDIFFGEDNFDYCGEEDQKVYKK